MKNTSIVLQISLQRKLRSSWNFMWWSYIWSQDSNLPPHKISWRSKLLLRRYLQNNTDVCLILNIQCIFTNIQNTSPPTHQSVKIILNLLEFLETIYKNVRISGEKGDLSHFVGSLLARVIRSKLISVQLDHPVWPQGHVDFCLLN